MCRLAAISSIILPVQGLWHAPCYWCAAAAVVLAGGCHVAAQGMNTPGELSANDYRIVTYKKKIWFTLQS